MKIHRSKNWKFTLAIRLFCIAFLISEAILFFGYIPDKFAYITVVLSILFASIIIVLCNTLSYIVINDDIIAVRNIIFQFRKARFNLNIIDKVEIGNTGGLNPDYFRIHHNSGFKTRRYVIDLVGSKKYPELIRDFQERGVKVEIKGIVIE